MVRFESLPDLHNDWVVVQRSPTDPGQFQLVAADGNPQGGPFDVELDDLHPEGPLTIRCEFCATVDATGLLSAKRVAVFSNDVVSSILQNFEAIDRGSENAPSVDELEDELEDEGESEQQEWLDGVRSALQQLQQLHQPLPVIRLADFHQQFLPGSSVALLAADGELVDAVNATLPPSGSPPLGVDVPLSAAGQLFAEVRDQQLRLWYRPKSDELPPEINVLIDNNPVDVDWKSRPATDSGGSLFYSNSAYGGESSVIRFCSVHSPSVLFEIDINSL